MASISYIQVGGTSYDVGGAVERANSHSASVTVSGQVAVTCRITALSSRSKALVIGSYDFSANQSFGTKLTTSLTPNTYLDCVQISSQVDIGTRLYSDTYMLAYTGTIDVTYTLTIAGADNASRTYSLTLRTYTWA